MCFVLCVRCLSITAHAPPPQRALQHLRDHQVLLFRVRAYRRARSPRLRLPCPRNTFHRCASHRMWAGCSPGVEHREEQLHRRVGGVSGSRDMPGRTSHRCAHRGELRDLIDVLARVSSGLELLLHHAPHLTLDEPKSARRSAPSALDTSPHCPSSPVERPAAGPR